MADHWFQRVPERKVAKIRQHFDLRAMGAFDARARPAGRPGRPASAREDGELVVMTDPEGNEFCLET